MAVDDWGVMLECQSCSRGERSRTWTNKNCHFLRGVQLTLGDECECRSACTCAHAAISLGTDILSRWHQGEKQANMLVQRCAMGENRQRPFDLPTVTGRQGVLLYCATSQHWETSLIEVKESQFDPPEYCSVSCLSVALIQANCHTWHCWQTECAHESPPSLQTAKSTSLWVVCFLIE